MLCREIVKEHESNHVNFDTLVTKVTPKARALVPDTVKKELLQKIKTHLTAQKEQWYLGTVEIIIIKVFNW